MNKLSFILASFFFISCKSVKISSGKFKSSCYLQTRTELILTLDSDSTFKYEFAFNDEKIVGYWNLQKDTLVLRADKFSETRDRMSPKIKNTDLIDMDLYLVKKNKLYPINKEGVAKECYLEQIKN